ncbi:MAG: hypothetical protein K2N60_05240 [Oscillospiraceae bacterium]|nr:hypothetical protein [Oscillospiraceae bacterium]
MRVNNINTDSHAVWNSSTAAVKTETADFSNVKKIANADKFVLNLPTSETVCKRTEFVTDERMGEGCAYCYTYMERTLTFESEKYGISTISSGSTGGYFVINLDKNAQTFGKSGADMNNIEHAVEETWERKDRALEQSTISGSLSGAVTGNNQTVGGSLGFAAQIQTYKYLSASTTKGTVAYKNGGVGNYREIAVSSREIYNKCAVFLAEVFGEKSSDLVLSDRAFNELFGELNGDEKTFSGNAAQKCENLQKQLSMLKEFMEKNLASVRQKDPDCGSLKTFADTYLKLGTYKYSDITSFVEKMLTSENAAGTKK